jgi:enamine deaminase RidA (YjgF/YER057c/UK114 family)
MAKDYIHPATLFPSVEHGCSQAVASLAHPDFLIEIEATAVLE